MPNNENHLIVREAIANDAEELEVLLRQLVDNDMVSVLAEQLQKLNTDQNNYVFVVEQGGAVLGTAQLTLCSDIMFKKQPYAVIENVIVSEHSRNLGIGRALIKAIEKKCIESDCSKIMLLSNSARSQAHKFFMANGYSDTIKKGFVKYRKSFSDQE